MVQEKSELDKIKDKCREHNITEPCFDWAHEKRALDSPCHTYDQTRFTISESRAGYRG